MVRWLTQWAADELGDGATPLHFALLWVEGGKTLNALASQLELAMGEPLSSGMLSTWLKRQPDIDDPDQPGVLLSAAEALTRARESAAHALVDQAVDIADLTPLDADAIARSRLQISTRQWTASKWNRKAYGDDKTKDAPIHIGNLHLAVLVAHQPRNEAPKLPAPQPAIEGVDYEVVKQLS